MKKLIITILALSFGLFFISSTIFAQDDVFIRERETKKIQELRILYRDEVEVYRSSERGFTIAKTNYEQIQTLAALEEAVMATKQVMQDRLKVMVTYLELIDTVLSETNGIELDLKNTTHNELFTLITTLKLHQDNIAVSNDRQTIAVLADEFEPIAANYTDLVYKTLSLIRIGRIQEVHDKAKIIETDIILQHESEDVSTTLVSKRKRAYDELDRNFTQISQGLVKLNEKFLEKRTGGYSRSFYDNILEDLAPIYAQISRSLDNLEELIKL